jgi:NAD(P)-dependent dehydrogenase (short-subunit alcohol dehydrogenase family)
MAAAGERARVALVIGGVRGLGLAVARALAARGERVHVAYRSSTALAAELERELAGRVHRADALDEAALAALAAEIESRDGPLGLLVHSVGEYVSAPLDATPVAAMRRMLASNVESAFAAFGAARAQLRRTRGCAVFFGTAGLDGARARRRTAAYAAAKTALLVVVRSLALEEAAHGVRVNMVSPGHVPHPHASEDTLDPERWARIPLGRPGAPADVASAVVWLASADASYVTGANLEVAGGFLL